MNKIIKSVAIIAFVAAIAVGATSSYFTDEEKSTGNTFTAGTIDIAVDNQNPWNTHWTNKLDKPSQTNYMNFTIKNVGENPANVWKKITVTSETGGTIAYCNKASSEPEYTEGGGTVSYNGTALVCGGSYVERDDLSSYMVYDMSICKLGGSNTCLLEGTTGNENPKADTGWQVIIDASHEVRVDNVNNIWIKLTDNLLPNEQLLVSQSYHLKAWNDAAEDQITNWAQGDVMTFDVELLAMQLTAPGPNGAQMGTLTLKQKDTTTWNDVTNGANGTMTYNTSGTVLTYNLNVTGLNDSTQYSLIYYADPWPGNHPGALLGTFTPSSGTINVTGVNSGINYDLPVSTDANYPVGAKIWLIPSSAYTSTTFSVTSWSAAGGYLFEGSLISFDAIP